MIDPSRVITRSVLITATGLGIALAGPVAAAPGKGDRGHRAMPHHCMMQAGAGARRLTVTGEGEARVAPDLATIQLGVTSQADSAAEAMSQTSTQQREVIEALSRAGIPETDIRTSGLNLNPLMDYGENRAPRVTGYQASNRVTVRVSEIGELGSVLDAIVAAGANEISGIEFSRENGMGAQDRARRAAVADARHKAQVLAKAAGLRLGPVMVLRDSQISDGPRPMMRMAADAATEGAPVAAGQLSMNASVQMEYALMGGRNDCRDEMRGKHHDMRGKPGQGGKRGDRGADAQERTAPQDRAQPQDGAASQDDTDAPNPEAAQQDIAPQPDIELPEGHPPIPADGADTAAPQPADTAPATPEADEPEGQQPDAEQPAPSGAEESDAEQSDVEAETPSN
ncbi:SIMPL domain-containing protein [Paracoccus stylophorae]|uniref:SIMPL domain-containing protein n=1 Tax=Paracoccus stylophorae TaxID=659350 RepID=A0ABY7SRY3_9RHOB|nr:SIMPL domain-containing protein [Paracoccus stylophorae]WCR09263.1 SIMPL domain-containing protein [Paracoccus stylophorae]